MSAESVLSAPVVPVGGYAALMPTAAELNASRANENAIARIDGALVDISGRSLVDTSEMADVLLDLRQLLTVGQN